MGTSRSRTWILDEHRAAWRHPDLLESWNQFGLEGIFGLEAPPSTIPGCSNTSRDKFGFPYVLLHPGRGILGELLHVRLCSMKRASLSS